jgi:hypothetical protein
MKISKLRTNSYVTFAPGVLEMQTSSEQFYSEHLKSLQQSNKTVQNLDATLFPRGSKYKTLS